MLILTRRIGETLIIGDNIKITIQGINGNQVKIGVDAPKDIPVHREEVYERIRAEKELQRTRNNIDNNEQSSQINYNV